MPNRSHVECDLQDAAGNLFDDGTQVRWFDLDASVFPTIWSDRAGTVSKGNPFTIAPGTTKVSFYTAGGRYRLDLLVDGIWTTLRTDFGIGTARELDIEEISSGGAVTGPAISVDNRFAQFNGTTGKIIKDGGLLPSTDGTLAANLDTNIPTQKAVKTYADLRMLKSANLSDVASKSTSFINLGGPDVINVVRDHGADPTGATSSQTAINAAIAALNAGPVGGILYFPKGIYSVTGALTNIDSNKMPTVCGAGPHSTTITTSSATTNVFNFAAAAGGGAATTCRIRDLGITSSVTRSGTGAMIAFQTTASFGWITNVRINKCCFGIDVQWNGGVIQDVMINEGETTALATAEYIRVRNGSYGTLIHNVFTGAVGTANRPAVGINLLDCDGCLISDCQILACGHGIRLSPGAGNGVYSTFISNCYFDTCGTGIDINPTSTGQTIRTNIDNVQCNSAGFVGLYIGNTGASSIVEGVHVSNSEFAMCANYGIVLDAAGACHVGITNCRVHSNGQIGIYAAGANSDFIIANCFSGDYGGGSGNTTYGIAIDATCDWYTVVNNMLRGNGTGGLIESGGPNKVVTGNLS